MADPSPPPPPLDDATPTPPPGWPAPPPPQQRRGGMIAIVAAIIIAGALIAAAILFRGGTTAAPAEPAGGAVAAPTVVEETPAPPAPIGMSTCEAWVATAKKLDAYPRFPLGWSYETPGIMDYIEGRNAAFTPILDTFETQIQPEPAHVKVFAEDVIARSRTMLKDLVDGTYVRGGGTPVDAAVSSLNRACGLG